MKNNEIKINKDALLKAYKNGDEKERNLLERLYGKKMFQPKNVMERVKTFEDAIKELGNDHPLVRAYDVWNENGYNNQKDVDAFFKLRIITAALNEGWKPTFAENEYRYYPWFTFYTQEVINRMDNYERAKVWLLDKPIGKYAGLAYAVANNAPSSTIMRVGSLLCFKTYELAEYAGKQFIKLYADFFLK